MKRYWKLISLVTVIVLAIGTFYIQSSLAASNNPEFVFEKVSGNEEEVDNLSISADYYLDGGHYNNIKITSTETTSRSDTSFLERLEGMHRFPDIKRLQEDYRNFMRGKTGDTTLFYEDEKVLAYADIKWDHMYNYGASVDFSFDIDVLDKNTNDTTAIQLDVPNNGNFSYIGVEDVQVINQQLKLTAILHPHGSEESFNETEIHVYTFELTNEELVSDEMILAVPWGENSDSRTELFALNERQNLNLEKYFLFKKEVIVEGPIENIEIEYGENVITEVGEQKVTVTDREIFAYHYETGELIELSLPEELQEIVEHSSELTVNNSTIYFNHFTESGLEVASYHIDSEKIGVKQTFDLEITPAFNPFIKIANDKMYVIAVNYEENNHHNQKDTTVLVADLKSGESLYKGTLKVKDSNPNETQSELYISDVTITD